MNSQLNQQLTSMDNMENEIRKWRSSFTISDEDGYAQGLSLLSRMKNTPFSEAFSNWDEDDAMALERMVMNQNLTYEVIMEEFYSMGKQDQRTPDFHRRA